MPRHPLSNHLITASQAINVNTSIPNDTIQQKNMNPPRPPDTLPFPTFPLTFLEEYLPKPSPSQSHGQSQPHVTLTYATSLDSKIAQKPGTQTVLSGPSSKLMTHYLRSRHDAILVGVGTVRADDPGLNCRLDRTGMGGMGMGEGQPRPVILDPNARWDIKPECRMLRTAREGGKGKGKAPWVIVSSDAKIPAERVKMLREVGGDFLRLDLNGRTRLAWEDILHLLESVGIRSVMVEGGGCVISELLGREERRFVDSVVVTIAPVFLGVRGVGVAPEDGEEGLRLREVTWQVLEGDVVMCGRI